MSTCNFQLFFNTFFIPWETFLNFLSTFCLTKREYVKFVRVASEDTVLKVKKEPFEEVSVSKNNKLCLHIYEISNIPHKMECQVE